MEITLIANTGLQFYTTHATIDTSAPATYNEIPVPTLMFSEHIDDSGERDVLELMYPSPQGNMSLGELSDEKVLLKQVINGEEILQFDVAGRPVVKPFNELPINMLSLIPDDRCYSEFNIDGAFMLVDPDTQEMETPFQRILGKWIPVPMFLLDNELRTKNVEASGWCRLKIEYVKDMKVGKEYSFTWAFDTQLADSDFDTYHVNMNSESKRIKVGLSTDIPHTLEYLRQNEWVSDYMGHLIFGWNKPAEIKRGRLLSKCSQIAYFINLFTQLRVLDVAPVVTLYNDSSHKPVLVDLVLDIGNSRTCGMLFENEDFTQATMLSLRDMTDPRQVYKGSFDMRLAFHRTEFGQDNMDLNNVFQWRSAVRIGEEARKLICKSRPADGLSMRLTHHSSPKRFLWDKDKFNGHWEFLLTDEDPLAIQRDGVSIPQLTVQFNPDGSFRTQDNDQSRDGDMNVSFSRSSLMTMALVEMLQQAMCQINSYEYVNPVTGRGQVDRKRVLNNIIVTCPTAMSQKEQLRLRECAYDAYVSILRSMDHEGEYYEYYEPSKWEDKISVIPSSADLNMNDVTQFGKKVEWSYDEASCCQLVYLYAEINEHYRGNAKKFIESKGHVRPEFKDVGYDDKSLTIGSVDIGAGTTDLMICSYKYQQLSQQFIVTPVPLFWDSYYFAGDDILHQIVLNHVLKEPVVTPIRDCYGTIYNAICSYMTKERYGEGHKPTDSELAMIRLEAKEQFLSFFGTNHSKMPFLDLIMRNDFNVQVSVPLAQKMMDMLKNSEPAQDITYSDIFPDIKPSGHLLDFFCDKFGFRFESLKWNYSPERLEKTIRIQVEKLLRQLSVLLDVYDCDIVLLAGRPTSLQVIADLFLKFFPVSPDRLIRLMPENLHCVDPEKRKTCYRVGRWFPSSNHRGYFEDLKPVVAVGAMVGYLGSHGKLSSFQIDMKEMKKRMKSTAVFLGNLDCAEQRIHVQDIVLSPEKNSATLDVVHLPYYIGCKQICSEHYQARPLFALVLKQGVDTKSYDLSRLKVTVMRNYVQNREVLTLMNAFDARSCSITDLLDLRIQSITSENDFWLDNGAFKFD